MRAKKKNWIRKLRVIAGLSFLNNTNKSSNYINYYQLEKNRV